MVNIVVTIIRNFNHGLNRRRRKITMKTGMKVQAGLECMTLMILKKVKIYLPRHILTIIYKVK